MYTLRIPGHMDSLRGPPDLTGSKEHIARQILFPDPDKDIHQVRRIPKDAECILEKAETISTGRQSRTEVHQIGRWSLGQLLPNGLLTCLF